MIHSIFILNKEGVILIEKHFRGLINRNVCDAFWTEVTKSNGNLEEVNPILSLPKFYLVHIRKEDLFYVALIAKEFSPLLIIEFLQRVHDVFATYFNKTASEDSLRENFVTVYQLLDEMMDNGFPFTTEPNTLVEIIPPPNVFNKVVGGITGQSNMSGELGTGTLSMHPWRKNGVKYSSNEIYIDITESIDATVESNGMASNTEVSGEVAVQCKLSGIPDLTLYFTNPHILDDVSFHPCVRYNRYEQNKVVSFIPPDGNFKLMNYRVKGQLQLPIYVKPQFSFHGTSGKVNIMVGSKAVGNKPVEDILITIPFPKAVSTASLTANIGAVQYDDITRICKWTISKIPKDKSPILDGTVQLIAGSTPEGNPVVQADFKIMQYAVSGLKVDTLTLHNERYKPYKGVRFITKAGKLHVRS